MILMKTIREQELEHYLDIFKTTLVNTLDRMPEAYSYIDVSPVKGYVDDDPKNKNNHIYQLIYGINGGMPRGKVRPEDMLSADLTPTVIHYILVDRETWLECYDPKTKRLKPRYIQQKRKAAIEQKKRDIAWMQEELRQLEEGLND